MSIPRLVAAAGAALLAPAEGLAAWGHQLDARSANAEQNVRVWLDEAAVADEALDAETAKIMNELANASLGEAGSENKQEQEVMEDYKARVDRHGTPKDLEKEGTSEDVGVEAGLAHLKNVVADHVAGLIHGAHRGEVDPANTSEMADLMAALVDPKNASEMADLAAALSLARRWPNRRAARASSEGTPETDSQVVEAINSWMQEAKHASQDLEKETKYEESDFAEAVPKGEEEKRLERLGDILDEVDPKNASEMADLAAALAQARRRPNRKAAHVSSEDVPDADSKVVESMRSWVEEAKKASQDFEKEAKYEESDFAEAVPKGEEEKKLERLGDILDGVDPKNASEMADLAAALVDPKNASEVADLVAALAQARRPNRKVARQTSDYASEADSNVVEAMKNWTQEAKQASQDLEKEIKYEESDFGQAVPKGEEEKRLERLGDMLDEVDPKNASEMADLAAALAQAEEEKRVERLGDILDLDPKNVSERADLAAALAQARVRSNRKEAKQASEDPEKETEYEESDPGQAVPKGEEEKRLERLAEADSKVVDAMKGWVKEARQSSADPERTAEHETEAGQKGDWSRIRDALRQKRLERLGGILDGVDPNNESEMADLAAALVDPTNTDVADLVGKVARARSSSAGASQKAVADSAASPAGTSSKLESAVAAVDAAAGATSPGAGASQTASADLPTETSNQLESAINAWIADYPEDVPSVEMEKILARVQGLIDATDPGNASELAGLAASLSRPSYITHRIGMPPSHSAQEWTAADTAEFWSWLEEAQVANDNPVRDFDLAEEAMQCASWCRGHTDVWDMKCTFKGCGACEPCAAKDRSYVPKPGHYTVELTKTGRSAVS